MATKSESQILQLGDKIQSLAKSLADKIEREEGETTQYKRAEWDSLTIDLQNSIEELLLRVVRPKTFLHNLQLSHYDLVAFQVAFEFHLFDSVPLSGHITLSELSKRAGMDEDRIGRVMRLLAIHGVFTEVEEEVFTHTAISKLLAQDEPFHCALAAQHDEMFQAASSTAEAIKKSPHEQRADLTPFSLRFGSSIYDFYQKHPARADRFGKAMEGATAFDEESMNSLRECYDWSSLENGVLVDVGGGAGHVSIFLAKHFPNISFLVQDLFPPPALGSDNQLAPKVKFQQHNFFEPQPVTNAKAYFMKHSLHNHPDADCVRILRSLVAALEKAGPATPLLINEGVLPSPGESMRRDQELTLRRGDMCMMVTLSAKERTRKQFQQLLKEADPRLQIVKIHGSAVTKLIEVHLV
ncbi:S-adenosyl-L-methionine-dependent methyltransferase [Trichoderma camerunense]